MARKSVETAKLRFLHTKSHPFCFLTLIIDLNRFDLDTGFRVSENKMSMFARQTFGLLVSPAPALFAI